MIFQYWEIANMRIGRRIKLARVARGLDTRGSCAENRQDRSLIFHIEKNGEAFVLTLRLIYEALEISNTSDGPDVLEKLGVITNGQPGSSEYYRQEINRLKHEIGLLFQLLDAQKEIIPVSSGDKCYPFHSRAFAIFALSVN